MGFLSDIEKAGGKIEDFLKDVATGEGNLQTIYAGLSGPVLAAVAAVYYDVVKDIASGTAVVGAVEAGSIPTAITLSATTLSLVEKTVADVKSGIKTVVDDFEALNIKL